MFHHKHLATGRLMGRRATSGGRDTWAGLRADRCGGKPLNLHLMYEQHKNSLFISRCFIYFIKRGFDVWEIIRKSKQISYQEHRNSNSSNCMYCSTLKYIIHESTWIFNDLNGVINSLMPHNFDSISWWTSYDYFWSPCGQMSHWYWCYFSSLCFCSYHHKWFSSYMSI